jgi:hypothetical protein
VPKCPLTWVKLRPSRVFCGAGSEAALDERGTVRENLYMNADDGFGEMTRGVEAVVTEIEA